MVQELNYDNPFTPSFGEAPVYLADRREVVSSISRALSSAHRRPELTSVFYGARGTGKTTLLSVAAHIGQQNGWIVASTTAIPGMLNDIEIQAFSTASSLRGISKKAAHASKLAIPNVMEIGFQENRELSSNWRSRMSDVLDSLAATDTGLLITVDEVDPHLDELVQLAAIYQHFVRENRKVALLMAGLPAKVSALISHKSVSFLRRAMLVKLGRIADYDVADAFRKTVVGGGRTISDEAVNEAVKSIDGFAYLLQLVGYRTWDVDTRRKEITLEDVLRGTEIAQAEMESRILSATHQELTPADIKFVTAMLIDSDKSRTVDLAKRLGWSAAQVGQYRRRLIDAGVIASKGRGIVAFEMPYYREYLAELGS